MRVYLSKPRDAKRAFGYSQQVGKKVTHLPRLLPSTIPAHSREAAVRFVQSLSIEAAKSVRKMTFSPPSGFYLDDEAVLAALNVSMKIVFEAELRMLSHGMV